jgi:nitroimidazol reductase NimA-like FMN-containing flavoprotein (pyridoxamine 5'-phosphate oxidase superfamily)
MTRDELERPSELFQLDRATCVMLLTTQHVGRLVIGGDEPTVVPVNYTAADGIITFRTVPDGRADTSATQPVVFEVDMFDDRTHSGWSVVVRGELTHVSADEHHADVESWAPGERDRWMIVPVETVTGRLLRGAVDAPAQPAGGYL